MKMQIPGFFWIEKYSDENVVEPVEGNEFFLETGEQLGPEVVDGVGVVVTFDDFITVTVWNTCFRIRALLLWVFRRRSRWEG